MNYDLPVVNYYYYYLQNYLCRLVCEGLQILKAVPARKRLRMHSLRIFKPFDKIAVFPNSVSEILID